MVDDAKPEQADTAQPDPVQDQRSRAQERINQLVGARHAAEQQTQDAQLANRALSAQLEDLTAKLETMSAQRVQSFAPADPFSPVVPPSPVQAPAQSEDLTAIVQRAVGEAVAPLLEQRQQDQLKMEQQKSFDDAAIFVPEVAQAGSPAAQLFEELWARNQDLHASRNAPGIIVNAVAGILQGVPQAAPGAQDAVKQIMTSPTISPAAPAMQRLDALPQQADKDANTLKEIVTECETVGTDVEDFAKMFALKSGRAKSAD